MLLLQSFQRPLATLSQSVTQSQARGIHVAGEWIPGAVIALAGTALVFWRNQAAIDAKISEKISKLEEDDLDQSNDLREATKVLQSVATQVSVSVEKQSVVNEMVANTLKGINDKLEFQSHQLAEHAASIQLSQTLLTKVMRS